MFGTKKEMKALAGLKGIAADAITAEQLAAVNAELAEAGIEGVQLVHAGLETIAAADLEALNAQVEDLTAANADLTASNNALTAELETLKPMGGADGAASTNPGGDDDDTETPAADPEAADDFNARVNASVSRKYHVKM